MKANVPTLLVIIGTCSMFCLARPTVGSAAEGDAPPPIETYTPEEKAAAAKLRPSKDPFEEQKRVLQQETLKAWKERRFADLDQRAAGLRAKKELTGNGGWRIAQFYDALALRSTEADTVWQAAATAYNDWITAMPESITARVAYARFLTDYAWKARGTGFADSVTEAGAHQFEERLEAAHQVLLEGRKLKEKDPCWWLYALTVALGQGWESARYDELLTEGRAFEPKFWRYDTTRAHSLLPRWYGKPGDWEAFAANAAARPEGIGVEVYTRVVIGLRGYYDNIFRDSQAQWPKTRTGFIALEKAYPESLLILSEAALVATEAGDRAFAKEQFEKLGDRFLRSVWDKPERFIRARRWANGEIQSLDSAP